MRRAWLRVLAVACLVIAGGTGCSSTTPPQADRPGLLAAPPMGWNSWDSGIDLTEGNVESVIDAMVSSGMRDAGYRYVDLDAGWAAPRRDDRGHLEPDPGRFPHGIAAVADYAHRRGMKLGIYASPYDEGCSAEPALASVGHEDQDARDFADWGVDLLKYDWCRSEFDHASAVTVFSRMGQALHATGRPIVYAINPNSSGDPTAGVRYDWSGIADMARTSSDLVPVWRESVPPVGPLDPLALHSYLGVPEAFATATTAVQPSRPGFWSDPDMLVVGLGWDRFVAAHFAGLRATYTEGAVPQGDEQALQRLAALPDPDLFRELTRQPNLTEDEQRAHFSLWAMLSAPLIAGNDVRTMSAATRDILLNRDVIAVDQDAAAEPVRPTAPGSSVLIKPLSDGSVAVAFVNLRDTPTTADAMPDVLGLPKASCHAVRDLWAHTETTSWGPISGGTVAPHGVNLFRVAPGCG